MTKAARAVHVPGAPTQAAAPTITTEQAPGAADSGDNPGDTAGSADAGPSEADILREQLAALQAQNEAMAAQLAAAPTQAAQTAPAPVVAAPVAPAPVGLHPSQKAVQTEKGWIVPSTYGSPVNRAR